MFRQDITHLQLFQGLNSQQLSLLEPILEICQFAQDQTIFEQGQQAEYLYILLRGEVVIRYKPYDGPPLTVAHILPSGVFGWSAAMAREVYTSCAVTVAASEAFRISSAQLRSLCECNPEAGQLLLDRLASMIAERLQHTHKQIMSILSQ